MLTAKPHFEMHTKEEITPYLLKTVALSKSSLTAEIGSRLTSSKQVRNHGSYRTFYLFNVWDIHQADVLHHDHFCYSFGYYGSDAIKLRKNAGFTWHLLLWINT